MTRHVVMFSSGAASAVAAKRVAAQQGTDSLVLLFCDVLGEDADNYRFLAEAAAWVGGTLVRVADGRTIWQVFRDRRLLGNHRLAPCSVSLKQQVAERWLQAHADPADTVRYVGFDWNEPHRLANLRRALPQWRIEAPLMAPPYLTKADMLDELRAAGIAPPRLYDLGFPHANCGGGCVRAGSSHWLHLLRVLPDRFAVREAEEQAMRAYLGKDVAMLTDRSGGDRRPLTLATLRARHEAQPQTLRLFDDDWGGCGCFADDVPDAAP